MYAYLTDLLSHNNTTNNNSYDNNIQSTISIYVVPKMKSYKQPAVNNIGYTSSHSCYCNYMTCIINSYTHAQPIAL